MIGHNNMEKVSVSRAAPASWQDQKLQERIDQNYAMSRRSLWEMLLFLLICICAYRFREFNLFETATEPIRQLLGYPPPAYLISIALAVYCFSSSVLTLTAMANDARPIQNWHQFGYRCSFFVFYSFSGMIGTHFLPVLLVGVFLYALDYCHIRIYHAKVIQQLKLSEKY